MRKNFLLAGSALAACLAAWSASAEGVGVMERARPDYDQVGLRLGAFMLYPSLRGGIGYDDNVYNVNTGETSDEFYTLGVGAALKSGWSRHAFNASFNTRSIFYASENDENHTDIHANAEVRLDMTRSTNFVIEGRYDRQAEERGSPDLPGFADEPTEFSIAGAALTFNHAFNRLTVSAGTRFDIWTYEDVPIVGGGTFNNDDRDRDVWGFFAKAAFEFSPGYNMFVRSIWNQRDYDTAVDDFGFNRDSDGYQAVGGIEFELTRLLVGEIYAGYSSQDYDDPALLDADGFSFGAGLEWYPSMLTTVHLDASTTVEETTIIGASGYLSRRASFGIDHELFRNVILSSRISYTNNDYEGVAREDKIWATRAGLRYLLNRHFEVDFAYHYSDRDTNAAGQDYTTHVLELQLVGKI